MSINRINLSHLQDIPLAQGELVATVSSSSVDLPEDLSLDEIDRIWERVQSQRTIKMVDRQRYFLKGIECNQLQLSLGAYRLFLATNERFRFHRDNGILTDDLLEHYLHTGYSVMGLSAVVLSSEGAILVQRRSGTVTQGAGTYMTPAGGFMPGDYSDTLMTPDPFISAHVQLLQEQGIAADEVMIKYVGLSSDTIVSPNPGLTFYGQTSLTMETLEAKWRNARDNRESDFIRFISSAPDDLLRTIRGELKDISGAPMTQATFLGVGLGGLMLYGKAQFGNDWFVAACQEAVKNIYAGIDAVQIRY